MFKLFSAAIAVFLFCFCPAGAQTASISGKVVTSGQQPIVGATVIARVATNPAAVAYVYTAADGAYTFTGLAGASYYVYVQNAPDLWLSEVYPNVRCDYDCDYTKGSPLVVSEGTGVTGVDFVLEQGAQISGQITGILGQDTLALPGVQVQLFDALRVQARSYTSSKTAKYGLYKLIPGTYYLATQNPLGYFDQVLGYGNCIGDCASEVKTNGTPITVQAGESKTIDIALQSGGGFFTGTVLDRFTQRKLTPLVEVYQNDVLVSTDIVSTKFAGTYATSGGFPPGLYRLKFRETNYHDFVQGCGENCPVANGANIAVTGAGAVTTNVTMYPKSRCSDLGDRDGDGSPNCYDQCDTNPLKAERGVCGCYLPDADTNANGVLDCQTKDEVKVQVSALYGLVKDLKPGTRRQTIGTRASLKVASDQLATYLNQYSISALSSMSNAQAAKFLVKHIARVSEEIWNDKHEFKKSKRKIMRLLSQLSTAMG